MSDDMTARLALPLLDAGQAQKEMTHNAALALLDIAVQPVVVAGDLDTPPETPQPGECWLVGTAPTGEWTGQAGAIAGWTAAGWRFVAPADGMTVWLADRQVTARRIGGAWVAGELRGDRVVIGGVAVVGARGAAIADPVGGNVIDGEARATLASILSMLRTHGLIDA